MELAAWLTREPGWGWGVLSGSAAGNPALVISFKGIAIRLGDHFGLQVRG